MGKQFDHGYALLIGVNENQVERWALPEVKKDVGALQKVLSNPSLCAYPSKNIKTLIGSLASRQRILDGLDWLKNSIDSDPSENTTAIIYYSGHGWRKSKSNYYLIPYDMREENIGLCAVQAKDFAESLKQIKPKRFLAILDCCHAAGMGAKQFVFPNGFVTSAIPADYLIKGERTYYKKVGAKGLEVLVKGKGRAVLSSSTGEQLSYVRKDGKMSIFTYHLIEALTGHAQPQDGATEVLVSDVMSYVWRHVALSTLSEWGAEQDPDYQVSGNFPIALLLGGKGLSKRGAAPDPLKIIRNKKLKETHMSIENAGAIVLGNVNTGGGNFIGRDHIENKANS